MIHHTIPTCQDLSWQDELKQLITDPKELIERLSLDSAILPEARAAAKLFPLRLTLSYANRIQPKNLNDPLLKQVLPIGIETLPSPGFTKDPLEEKNFNPVKGLIHKYRRRVLMMTTTSCAINCRYCFRRSFEYDQHRLTVKDKQNIIDYIYDHPEINELIFSGGDPLLQSDTYFETTLNALSSIPHLERIRIHSRLPIVLPSRMSSNLLSILKNTKFHITLVIHSNHAQEFDDTVRERLWATRQSGVHLLNQSVLLAGINDDVKTQTELAKALLDAGVLPYYLHLLDRVQGAAHFEVAHKQALALYEEMRAELPGYLLAKLVHEQPGESGKTIIGS